MQIERRSIDIEGAARVSGFSETELRNLINRERMFPEMDRKHGRPLSFKIQQLFILAAVRALIGLGFSIRAACDTAREHQIYGALLRGHEISLPASKDGPLGGIEGSHIAVSILVRPWPLFEIMKPGLIEIYGHEAVAELEQLKNRGASATETEEEK